MLASTKYVLFTDTVSASPGLFGTTVPTLVCCVSRADGGLPSHLKYLAELLCFARLGRHGLVSSVWVLIGSLSTAYRVLQQWVASLTSGRRLKELL
jgi:hypothetical protein